jgi:putative component of membrane protein insertase Oxa1/YidC/SpoIIIJ protein YidD
MWAIRLYQQYLTQHKYQCNTEPSCIQFGYSMFRDHGFYKGVVSTADKIQSCISQNEELL